MAEPLCQSSDVEAALLRPLTSTEQTYVSGLIDKASARLRQKCPFDIDERITLFSTTPGDPLALDPDVVADVVAGIVKRVIANPDGVLSMTEAEGPFSESRVFASRTSESGDSGSTLRVTDADLDQLRPSQAAIVGGTILTKPLHRACDRNTW